MIRSDYLLTFVPEIKLYSDEHKRSIGRFRGADAAFRPAFRFHRTSASRRHTIRSFIPYESYRERYFVPSPPPFFIFVREPDPLRAQRRESLSGRLSPATGSLVRSSTPYLVPQQTAPDRRNVAELLGITHKLRALRAICSGSVEPDDFETLGDDWEIEAQSRAALDAWGLSHVALDTPSDALSGGERTKTLLAGWTLHDPAIVLLDEPTNNLDIDSLAILTDTLRDYRGSLVVISHDDRFVREIGVTETVELSIG